MSAIDDEDNLHKLLSCASRVTVLTWYIVRSATKNDAVWIKSVEKEYKEAKEKGAEPLMHALLGFDKITGPPEPDEGEDLEAKLANVEEVEHHVQNKQNWKDIDRNHLVFEDVNMS